MARWVRIQNSGNNNNYFDVDSPSGTVCAVVGKSDGTYVIEIYSAYGATDHFGTTGSFSTASAANERLNDFLNAHDFGITP